MTQQREADAPSAADTEPSDGVPPVTSGSILLASVRTRFVLAGLLSLLLWAGYFWATASSTLR